MSINLEDPLAYEFLSRAIDEFEKAALETGKREAYMAVAHGPLTGIETVLDGSERVLRKVEASRKAMGGGTDEDGQPRRKASPKEVMEQSGIHYDSDLQELFGGDDNPTKNYLEECLGCNLRLTFDWQLKPLSLFGPIQAFLDMINDALDQLLARLDKFSILKEICWALNHLKTLCPADLILVLLALKLLLKKYLLQMFKIKIDWTILLGPLLKFIIDGITSLLEQIARIILAPIDCVLSSLKSANELLKAMNDFLGAAKDFGEGVGNIPQGVGDAVGGLGYKDKFGAEKNTPGVNGGLTQRDAQWISPKSGKNENGVPDPGALETNDRLRKNDGRSRKLGADEEVNNSFTFPAGFELNGNMSMQDALADPLFPNATFLEKLIIPVQEARNWIRELFDNIIDALRSLNGLVGAGLKLNLESLGILIFIADMIGLVMMIIRMIKMYPNLSDWCSHLQENPELLEEQLRGRFGEDLHVEAIGKAGEDNAALLLRQGPNTVGVINTCISHRADSDKQIINQWIADLGA